MLFIPFSTFVLYALMDACKSVSFVFICYSLCTSKLNLTCRILPLDSNIRFTSEEIAKFERRYENGFDISSDKRYNAWLKIQGLGGKYH